jgi:hypothetical protein
MLIERFKARIVELSSTRKPIYSYLWSLEKRDGMIIDQEYIPRCPFDELLNAMDSYGFNSDRLSKELLANGKCEFSFETDREIRTED